MKKIELVNTYSKGDRSREYLSCRVLGVRAGRFIVKRLAASDEAWAAVKERLFGDPAPDLPEGVAIAADGRMYAPGDVVQTLPDAGWQRRPRTAGSWYDSPNIEANDECVYEVRRRRSPRTERVALHLLPGRRLPGCEWTVGSFSVGVDGRCSAFPHPEAVGLPHVFSAASEFTIGPDGTVEVLTEDGPR